MRGKRLDQMTMADIQAADERMFFSDLMRYTQVYDIEPEDEPDYEAMDYNPSTDNPWENLK